MKHKFITSGAVLLALLTSQGVYASETTESPTTTAPETTQITTVAPETTEITTATPSTEAPVVTPVQVTKEGTDIKVTNPSVDLQFPNGKSKYAGFKVRYNEIAIPDSITINPGDTLTSTMPKEVTFKTSFDFDVTNPDNDVIGHASTNLEQGTITTVFNDIFLKKPLNKRINMEFDATWNDSVQPEQTVPLNFNGTEKSMTFAKEEGPTPGEMLAKWGSQAKEDPQVLRWTIRANFDKQEVTNGIIQDRWTSNQEYVPDSLNMFFIEDVVNWKGITDAKAFLDSFHVQSGGFDMKLKRFNKILYIEYRTRLKTSVKESNDPFNVAWFNADNGIKVNDYRSHIALVGGKGVASSDTIVSPLEEPTTETPTTQPSTSEEKPSETPSTTETPTTTSEEPKPETSTTEVPTTESSTTEESTKETSEVKEETTSSKSTVKALELPNTGTVSTFIYAFLGSFAVLGALYVLFSNKLKKKDTNSEE
jgi:LPXTG-motif cell wall-anchored protein